MFDLPELKPIGSDFSVVSLLLLYSTPEAAESGSPEAHPISNFGEGGGVNRFYFENIKNHASFLRSHLLCCRMKA